MRSLFALLLLCVSFGAKADFDLGDNYLGVGKTMACPWGTFNQSGSSATPATAGTVYVSKDGDVATQKAVVADLSGTDARGSGGAGKHRASFPITNAYFTVGSDYEVYVAGAIVDSQTINRTLCTFGIESRQLRGYVKTRGVASADDSSPNKICFNSNIVLNDGDFVGMTLWNYSTNEKYVIQTSTASTDCVTVLPNVHTTESAGNVLLVLNDPPQFPIDVVGAIGTPQDLGRGANLYANILDAVGIMRNGTCSSGTTTSCVYNPLVEADRYWINWAEIQVGTQPPRCVRGFVSSTHTLSWPSNQALPSTASGQTFVLRASPQCRNTP